MAILNLPRLSDYCSTDPLFKTYTWRKTMSRNRFFLLLRFWHFEIPCANERLRKIAFFMNHLNETMKRIYCPSENLSLDESMVLWRGRLIFRQYIKNKRHKYGIKFYELYESRGLILRSFIYSGLPYPDIHDLGRTGAIVLKLMEDFLGKGYTVFDDNYYNSVKLTNFMSKKQTYICGTLRSDRKGNPKEVVSKKLKKREVEWKRRETVVVSKWKDKRDVLTISNKHKLKLVPVKNKRGEVIMKPNIVSNYNNGMSGIDRSDKMLSYYQGLRKSVRWYKKIGFHFIEMFVHNSFYLFKQANPQNKMTLIKFRTEVVKSLLDYEKLSQIERKGSSNAHYPKLFPASEKKKNPTLCCKRCYKNG